jgi:hypothetical protein
LSSATKRKLKVGIYSELLFIVVKENISTTKSIEYVPRELKWDNRKYLTETFRKKCNTKRYDIQKTNRKKMTEFFLISN